MTPELSRAFARYNRWMNAKIYDAAARLSHEERTRDRGAFFGSIHATLNHVLVADRIWLGRIDGLTPEPGLMGPGGSSRWTTRSPRSSNRCAASGRAPTMRSPRAWSS